MTILVADDHPIYIEGLVNLLRSYDFTVTGRAQNGAEAVRLACRLKPDIVLMDANMPVMDGIEATRQIRAVLPATKVVILTGIEDDALLLQAVQAGASGFLLKRLDGDSLHKNLLELQSGRNPFSPELEDHLIKKNSISEKEKSTHFNSLAERDLSIMRFLVKGLTYKEIAARINLSEPAVKYHIKNIKLQYGVQTKNELITVFQKENEGR
jgi:DNA-binding NarL/FixJ family response regulator